MNTNQIKKWFKSNGLNIDTVSFYRNKDGDSDDSEYGYCDIAGVRTAVSDCVCLDDNGDVVEFQVDDDLIRGSLGKAVGAF